MLVTGHKRPIILWAAVEQKLPFSQYSISFTFYFYSVLFRIKSVCRFTDLAMQFFFESVCRFNNYILTLFSLWNLTLFTWLNKDIRSACLFLQLNIPFVMCVHFITEMVVCCTGFIPPKLSYFGRCDIALRCAFAHPVSSAILFYHNPRYLNFVFALYEDGK